MPEFDANAVAAAARRVRLAVDPRRRRHGAGNRLGSGPGASLEFHDHRPYVAGDDLRHLDWGVYGRSEQLVLRRHRVEVTPRVEILLDASMSMAIRPEKLGLATAIAALIATLAEADGARAHLWSFAGSPRRLAGQWREELRALKPAGAAGLEQPVAQLAAGAERVLISDGLCPAGGAHVARTLSHGAGRLCLVQVLCRDEADPQPLGAVRLEDVEGGAADLVLDAAACALYRERFARHQGEWQRALAGRGTGVVAVVAEDGFEAALAALARGGVVSARAA